MPPLVITDTTETAAGHNRQVIETAITPKREAIRLLRADLGITGAQANRLYSAYLADVADAQRIGNDTGRSDVAFLDWLMRQTPGGRARPVVKRGWAVTSR